MPAGLREFILIVCFCPVFIPNLLNFSFLLTALPPYYMYRFYVLYCLVLPNSCSIGKKNIHP